MTKNVNHTRNWRHYNDSLVERGNVFFWFDDECIKKWHKTEHTGKKGRPAEYADLAIECGLTLRLVFNLTFRSTQGLLRGIIDKLKLPLKAPHYTLLSKRQQTLKVNLKKYQPRKRGPLHLVIDSTGLKIYGEGEWKIKIHGKGRKCVWHKIHLAVDSATHTIVQAVLTGAGIQDCQGFTQLINAIDDPIEVAIGDGAYDRFSCYEIAKEKGFKMIAPPQRNAVLLSERRQNKRKASSEAIAARDVSILGARKLGRAEWKKEVGYHRRSLSETAMFRLKQLLGSKFKSRKREYQSLEVNIRCQILNKMALEGFGV